MAAPFSSLFKPGRNCCRSARARRATLIVDGEAYFSAFAQAALRATQTIVILGWDFHSRTRLHLEAGQILGPGVPDLLGDFLNFLAGRSPRLQIFILAWDSPPGFGHGRRERQVGSAAGWQPHDRITVVYDSNCPLGGALHQKVIVIDGAFALCGGTDLTLSRWDTPAHGWGDPRRTNVGETEPYGPVHDVMLAVDSGAARALQSLASNRWRDATGRKLPALRYCPDAGPWPDSLAVMFSDVEVALARTVPVGSGRQAAREVEALYLDMIAAAQRYIYIENQYFTAKKLGEALAERLAEPWGPEVIVVSRLDSSGWLEAPTMAALRTVLLHQLRDADAYGRFSAWYPDSPGQPCCDVHSKLMIVDDEWLRVGSANFANRSMGLDTECDLAVEAGGNSSVRAAIALARNTLLAEHLGVALPDVREALTLTRSLGAAVRALAGRTGRTLRRFEQLDEPSPAVIALAAGIVDPEHPPLPVDEPAWMTRDILRA
jgi:phosphatidylserine/phosphatidylglycerophosphate/cardiolipin synthase-like enzyme